MGMALPNGFHWTQFRDFELHYLKCGHVYVAVVTRRVSAGWLVKANSFLWYRPAYAVAPTKARAFAWTERWACANEARLRVAKVEKQPPSTTDQPTRRRWRCSSGAGCGDRGGRSPGPAP